MATKQQLQAIEDEVRRFRHQLVHQGHLNDPLLETQISDYRMLVTREIIGPNALLAGAGGQLAVPLDVQLPNNLPGYNDDLTLDQLAALADLYFLYLHDEMGLFGAVFRLHELMRGNQLRRFNGVGRHLLIDYLFSLRSNRLSPFYRYGTYRRVFGYGQAAAPGGAVSNQAFHSLFTNFINQIYQLDMSRRTDGVIQSVAGSGALGGQAEVQAAGQALRFNLKAVIEGDNEPVRDDGMTQYATILEILRASDTLNALQATSEYDAVERLLARDPGTAHLAGFVGMRAKIAIYGRDILNSLSDSWITTTDRNTFDAGFNAYRVSALSWREFAIHHGALNPGNLAGDTASTSNPGHNRMR